jgi:hypothetical protein
MIQRLLLALLLIGSSLLSNGCPAVVAGAGAGAGVYVYMKGELKRTYRSPLETVLAASKESLATLKMSVTETQREGFMTIIKARQADDKPVTVKITSLSDTLTEVSVRAGSVGVWDKQVAELVHATIAKNL